MILHGVLGGRDFGRQASATRRIEPADGRPGAEAPGYFRVAATRLRACGSTGSRSSAWCYRVRMRWARASALTYIQAMATGS